MKFYGNLNNRFDEGKQFVKEIKVGNGVTEYGYSDRHAYEVVEVQDQKHISIRQMKAVRVDELYESDSQDYKYESNPDGRIIKLAKRGNVWYSVREFSKQTFTNAAKEWKNNFTTFDAAYAYVKFMAHLTTKQYQKIEDGETVKKYNKMNISIGVMDEYYDYSF